MSTFGYNVDGEIDGGITQAVNFFRHSKKVFFLQFDELVRECWDRGMSDGVFRYNLEDATTRVVSGRYGFIVQV